MNLIEKEFGFLPLELSISVEAIKISTLPDLELKVSELLISDQIDTDWIYAPPREVSALGLGTRRRPYASRVFGLRKTHIIHHENADGEEHAIFLIWALSFFLGLRLTTTDAGFVDATPVKLGKLVDFQISNKDRAKAIAIADLFWCKNRAKPRHAKNFEAAVHALFWSQNPNLLQFEQFTLLYTALDACYALTKSLHGLKQSEPHYKRIQWMCEKFKMDTPVWAIPNGNSTDLSLIRNSTLHEGLFMEEPLGFALHGRGTGANLTLEMTAVICRFLVALIGCDQTAYVRTPVNTRNCFGLNL